MARNQKAQQKKALKKKQKRKKQLETRKTKVAASQDLLQMYAEQAQTAPVYKCLKSKQLFKNGYGTVLYAADLPTGLIALSGFILDLDKEGIRESFFNCMPMAQFEQALKDQQKKIGKLEPTEPSFLKKLVIGAATYGESKGHKVPKAYYTALKPLSQIDASECAEEFTYGEYKALEETRKDKIRTQAREEALPVLKAYYKALQT